MRKQVVHVSVHQTAKVIATMYAVVTFLIALVMAIYTFIQERDLVSALFILILMPLFYWIVFYISHAIALFFYNLVAKRLGGVEFDLEDAGGRPEVRVVNEPSVTPDRIDHI